MSFAKAAALYSLWGITRSTSYLTPPFDRLLVPATTMMDLADVLQMILEDSKYKFSAEVGKFFSQLEFNL